MDIHCRFQSPLGASRLRAPAGACVPCQIAHNASVIATRHACRYSRVCATCISFRGQKGTTSPPEGIAWRNLVRKRRRVAAGPVEVNGYALRWIAKGYAPTCFNADTGCRPNDRTRHCGPIVRDGVSYRQVTSSRELSDNHHKYPGARLPCVRTISSWCAILLMVHASQHQVYRG